MNPQLAIQVVYFDDAEITLQISASNGRYSGTTSVYIGSDGKELTELADKLKGFPKSRDHMVSVKWGCTKEFAAETKALGLKAHPAYAYFDFRCIDNILHTAVSVDLQEYSNSERHEANGNVHLELLFDPASLDNFVNSLSSLAGRREGTATLVGNTKV